MCVLMIMCCNYCHSNEAITCMCMQPVTYYVTGMRIESACAYRIHKWMILMLVLEAAAVVTVTAVIVVVVRVLSYLTDTCTVYI